MTGELHLTLEELEAIRLSDVEGLDQQAAADLMERYPARLTAGYCPEPETLSEKL